ncbi:MAG: response regulator [Desulfobulbaceae bacterium]|jgi:signal transduction histidine kinase/DNA-binding response OmpR family regulator|nr:response regulator [Desulfobulbaceae bacterium]
MMQNTAGFRQAISFDDLLKDNEHIVIVDDDNMIREPLAEYLEESGFPVLEARNAHELRQVMVRESVGLILLDIGLPDEDGASLIPELLVGHPGTAIIMLSGVADLHVAIDCIRSGADDYLAKPVKFNEILIIVKKVLEKRRLVFDNQKYQADLEQANFRFELLHQLSLKINSVHLTTSELDKVLYAILVGITANEGLRFNRAFLALFDGNNVLTGRLAIGPSCREEAADIWAELQGTELNFLDMVDSMHGCMDRDTTVRSIVEQLSIPAEDTGHVLVRSALEHKSYLVQDGQCEVDVPPELVTLLGERDFVIVPLFSAKRPLGVIIADNYVMHNPISAADVLMLELFGSQVSLALEHSQLHHDMQSKISELQEVTHELEHNKDLLVEAERYSALGQMAAQMVHVLRNPITSIGGVCRILAKKINGENWGRYLDVMIKETARLEGTLSDLVDFVSQVEPEKTVAPLYPVLQKTLMLVQPTMLKQDVKWEIDLDGDDPEVDMDVRQVRQMFLHIVRNGLEAMEEHGGVLRVVGRVQGDKVVVAIKDTGIGMAEVNIARAKDAFFTTKTYGSGMGLAMVERIVESHGGEFNLKRHDQGMEAVVTLPIA